MRNSARCGRRLLGQSFPDLTNEDPPNPAQFGTTQGGMDSYLSAADYRLGYLPCCGWSGPRERGILSTKPARRRLLAAQARPLWPMRIQLLGTHQQTNLSSWDSLQPLLWLPAHH